jgi:hypothetical protein
VELLAARARRLVELEALLLLRLLRLELNVSGDGGARIGRGDNGNC